MWLNVCLCVVLLRWCSIGLIGRWLVGLLIYSVVRSCFVLCPRLCVYLCVGLRVLVCMLVFVFLVYPSIGLFGGVRVC